jgi:hypothetical protein
MESPNLPRPKEVRQVKSKVKCMLIIFFDIKGIVHREFLLAGQTVNSAYYCGFYGDCVKMWEDSAMSSGDKIIGSCIMTTHRLPILFSPENFISKNNITAFLTHPTFLFP